MRYYKEIRFCRVCKKRFVVEQGRIKSYYCSACQKKYSDHKKKVEKE